MEKIEFSFSLIHFELPNRYPDGNIGSGVQEKDCNWKYHTDDSHIFILSMRLDRDPGSKCR